MSDDSVVVAMRPAATNASVRLIPPWEPLPKEGNISFDSVNAELRDWIFADDDSGKAEELAAELRREGGEIVVSELVRLCDLYFEIDGGEIIIEILPFGENDPTFGRVHLMDLIQGFAERGGRNGDEDEMLLLKAFGEAIVSIADERIKRLK